MLRAISIARSRKPAFIFGVKYGSSEGADEIFRHLMRHRPAPLLMESFALDAEVVSGGPLPYAELLPSRGVEGAMHCVTDASFRASWTAESVAVLSALSARAELRFADRLHSDSFDRLVCRRSLDELRHDLIGATEAVASAWEARGSSAALPQNALCPSFPELWQERHVLMAHHLRSAAAAADGADGAATLVCGAEHVEPIAALVEAADADADAEAEAEAVASLLAAGVADSSHGAEELEKRAAVAALLATTQAFPPGVVLPPAEALPEEAQAVVRASYPKYRAAFSGRLAALQEARRAQAAQPAAQTFGLEQLAGLCESLERAGEG